MNYQTGDIINTIYDFFTRIDLLMFSHINKRFRMQSQKYLLKNKNCCKFSAIGNMILIKM